MDLAQVLPGLDLRPLSHLIYSLEKNEITVADLVSVEPTEIARKCPLPLLDARRLVASVIECLQKDLAMQPPKQLGTSDKLVPSSDSSAAGLPTPPSSREVQFIFTLDAGLDSLLGGGLPTGYITEVVGESSAGKTQFLLGLLLSVQLPSPYGLGRDAIYISTEDPLKTTRLVQMLDTNPAYADSENKPSLDRIHSSTQYSLDALLRLVEFQLPIIAERSNAGLIVIDSVTANFRVERQTATTNGLVDRASDLTRLGTILRRLAIDRNIAVVVANQVSDRFQESLIPPTQDFTRSSSSPASQPTAQRNPKMSLDYQQRFFTGWGDNSVHNLPQNLKTPALGLTWANQIDARLVLKVEEDIGKAEKRRRFMNVVFAPWTGQKLKAVEYTIESQGLVSMPEKPQANDHEDLLDEALWADDADDEFA